MRIGWVINYDGSLGLHQPKNFLIGGLVHKKKAAIKQASQSVSQNGHVLLKTESS